jgi:hypothetical protein
MRSYSGIIKLALQSDFARSACRHLTRVLLQLGSLNKFAAETARSS